MRILFKPLQVGAGAVLLAGVVYLMVAAPGFLTDTASMVPTARAKVARR